MLVFFSIISLKKTMILRCNTYCFVILGKDFIEIAEDNNEFACGELLARCLDNYEGYNMIVCVSRNVEGCFVSDSVQHFKLRAVKEAAISALEILHTELTSPAVDEEGLINSNQNEKSHNIQKTTNKKKTPHNKNSDTLNTTMRRNSPIIFNPFSGTFSVRYHLVITEMISRFFVRFYNFIYNWYHCYYLKGWCFSFTIEHKSFYAYCTYLCLFDCYITFNHASLIFLFLL